MVMDSNYWSAGERLGSRRLAAFSFGIEDSPGYRAWVLLSAAVESPWIGLLDVVGGTCDLHVCPRLSWKMVTGFELRVQHHVPCGGARPYLGALSKLPCICRFLPSVWPRCLCSTGGGGFGPIFNVLNILNDSPVPELCCSISPLATTRWRLTPLAGWPLVVGRTGHWTGGRRTGGAPCSATGVQWDVFCATCLTCMWWSW